MGNHKPNRPAFECIALLLQGGGALGSYQGGVYQALAEAGLHPDWVAGISIGAINSAIIAGNPPETRVDRLRGFWQHITASPHSFDDGHDAKAWDLGDQARKLFNQLNAMQALLFGAPGFFTPRVPSPWLHPAGSLAATSYYDTSHLKATLERFVDFDRINAGEMRFSVGAVNVESGNFVYFDSTTHRIGPEHVMASGSLPPGFPAVEIEGQHYWDGGLISNTPLQWVVQSKPRLDTLAFQVDLWSARGAVPRDLAEVAVRQKDIQFSSRSRAGIDRFKEFQILRSALADLLDRLPDDLKDSPEARLLGSVADHKVYNVVNLIYRARRHEVQSKDYEFSRLSMEDHWRVGYFDTVRTLRHTEVLERPSGRDGVSIFDFTEQGRE